MQTNESESSELEKRLPGSSEAQDLGRISDEDLKDTQVVQGTQSIESTSTVITEKNVNEENLVYLTILFSYIYIR